MDHDPCDVLGSDRGMAAIAIGQEDAALLGNGLGGEEQREVGSAPIRLYA